MKQRKRKRPIHRCIIILCLITVICISGGGLLGQMCAENEVYPFRDYEVNDAPDLKNQLMELAQLDERAQEILAHCDEYPQELLQLLVKDPDTIDFVYDYPKLKARTSKDEFIPIHEGEVPLFLQWDQRWGYERYGDTIIALGGCAPAALAMAAAGLRKDGSIQPPLVARFADENGFYVNGVGSSWELIEAGAEHFGISATPLSLNKNNVFHALTNGNVIICSMAPGDFTSSGHFIVLCALQDGKIEIRDPNSKKRSAQLWEYERLATQISNLWVCSL